MKPENIIAQRVFVREYYRQNASFFLLVIGLAGGFMRSHDHIALAEFFVSSPLLLLIPFAIWILYILKVIAFNTEVLRRSENEFLFEFALLKRSDQWSASFLTIFNQAAPATFYGIFLIAIAIKYQLILSVGLVILMLTVLFILATAKLYYILNHPDQERKVNRLKRFIDRTFSKPYPIFFPEWILRRQPLMLIGSKVFSGALLLGIIYLYKTDTYDHRLLAMGIVVAASAQVPLLLELHQFENFHFSLVRQLPVPFITRFLYTLTTILLLTLIEIGLLITYFPISLPVTVLLQSILFFVSMLIFQQGLLYAKERTQEELMSRVFILAMVLIVLVLFKIPLILFTIIHLLAGIFIWQRNYYRFEYITSTK
jgi:hypothetical protein